MLDSLNHARGSGTDSGRMFLAKVIENKDPDQNQRIKVIIPGLLEGAVEDMPWLLPRQHTPFGGVSPTSGVMAVPHIDSDVVVFFQNGDLMYGMTSGTTTTKAQNLGVLLENYPARYGYVDPAGNHFYTDTTEGKVVVELRHKSGTVININDTGTVTITVVENVDMTVKGNVKLQVDGNVDESVKGNVTSNVDGNVTNTVKGNVTSTVKGNVNETVSGNVTSKISGTANLTVSGNITSKAPAWSHQGSMSIQGDVAIDGATTVTQTIVADGLILSSSDVIGGGISLVTHLHPGVRTGTGKTLPPE